MASQTAILLLAHGTPDRVEDVPCFLHAVTGGRQLPQAVIDEVQHRYRLIGRSPLRELTFQQAEAVQRELGLTVYVAMRNWEPYVRDVVPRMAAEGVTHAIAVCLAPQNSRTSTGLYRRALLAAGAAFSIDFVESWHDHPLLIQAYSEKLRQGWPRVCQAVGSNIPVIFTAHSVPTRTVEEGDPYERQARQTAEMVAQAAGVESGLCRFAFQSQGMSGGPWLGPTVEETIAALGEAGHKAIFIQPIGFLCDHIEVLYDIDIAFRKFADERGMRLERAESLNGSPLLVAALADVARTRLAAAALNTVQGPAARQEDVATR
jgi:ferrochelatase